MHESIMQTMLSIHLRLLDLLQQRKTVLQTIQ